MVHGLDHGFRLVDKPTQQVGNERRIEKPRG
jgi:hypothetical protein